MSDTIKVLVEETIITVTKDGIDKKFDIQGFSVKEAIKTIEESNPDHEVEVTYFRPLKESVIEKKKLPTFREKLRERLDKQVKIFGHKTSNKSQRTVVEVQGALAITAGVTAGVVFGKTVLTGAALGLGTYIVTEIVLHKPAELLINKLK